MAFDGIVIANLTNDIKTGFTGSHISKITQPEKDEILFTLKNKEASLRLLISANASLPLAYLTADNKPSPAIAPAFCMLLRKHLLNGKILDVTQPNTDRIIRISAEHFNEMGDNVIRVLYAELMGKYSNIILCDENDIIIDSIKRVPSSISSLREVLPGKKYFMPKSLEKSNPVSIYDKCAFLDVINSKKSNPIYKAIYSSFNGISPLIANEICHRAQIIPDKNPGMLSDEECSNLFSAFMSVTDCIRNSTYSPCIVIENSKPSDFSSIQLTMYSKESTVMTDNISDTLKSFYASRETYARIRQKSTDLRKIVSTALERTTRKYDLQLKQLDDTKKRDNYQLKGELITAYAHEILPGSKDVTLKNYYNDEDVKITLDPTLTATENAQKYFFKYAKLKRTYEALTELTEQTKHDIDHLLSVEESLKNARDENDLIEIKEELITQGYIKRKGTNGKKKEKKHVKSKPSHFISSDGFDMYVGRNNIQNDELTFKFANGGDWWFHAKKMPGSHVIVKTNGAEMTDRAFEEAGSLAAYFSAGKDSPKVEIDYLERKNVKKPNGAKPGYVIYYTNYSLTAVPDISALKEVR